MKNLAVISLLGIIFLAACGPGDNQGELENLKRKRDALNEKIARLEEEAAPGIGPASYGGPAASVTVERMEPVPFRHFIKVQGSVESDNNILIPARVSGLVKKIHAGTGVKVAKGQLLAELDGTIHEKNIAEVENALDLARIIFERQQRLWNKNIGSEIEYLRVKNNKENLEKKLDTLREQYNLTKITAPIHGTVDDILIKEGEMAAAGSGIIRIVQLSKLKVTADISENYISDVQVNDSVQVGFPVIRENFDLTIDAVSRVIDPDNRTFTIEIKVPAAEESLKPNMLAVVTINDYTNPQALVVPRALIQNAEASRFLFIAMEEKGGWIAKKRLVRTGESDDNMIEVIEGLNSGDLVISFGFQNLADGQRIEIKNSRREDAIFSPAAQEIETHEIQGI